MSVHASTPVSDPTGPTSASGTGVTPPVEQVEFEPVPTAGPSTATWFRRWSAGVRAANEARVPF